jgi:hypothetical protein
MRSRSEIETTLWYRISGQGRLPWRWCCGLLVLWGTGTVGYWCCGVASSLRGGVQRSVACVCVGV